MSAGERDSLADANLWLLGRVSREASRSIMTQRDANEWMWERAAELLVRAEKAQRQFFQLSRGATRPCWEPPIDIFETDQQLVIYVALPGAEPEHVEVGVDHGEIVVSARRLLPAAFAHGTVRRLEIPQGRFERRIALPSGRYELVERSMKDGCLLLRLSKVS
jgi:HSP20 family protein